jgi:hypothetical protein
MAAEIEVLRLVVVELVRRLPHRDRTAIDALVQQLATAAEDLSALPTSDEAAEELPHHQNAVVRRFLGLLQL